MYSVGGMKVNIVYKIRWLMARIAGSSVLRQDHNSWLVWPYRVVDWTNDVKQHTYGYLPPVGVKWSWGDLWCVWRLSRLKVTFTLSSDKFQTDSVFDCTALEPTSSPWGPNTHWWVAHLSLVGYPTR